VYPPVLVFWLVIHSKIDRWRRVGIKAYWIGGLAWPAISIPILYYREALFAVRWTPPVWLIVAGILAFVLGVMVAVQASRVIPKKTLVGLPELKPATNKQPLMNTGIYGRTRNPIYLAHSLFIFAMAAMTGFAASWALLAIDAIVLPLMIRAEEKELLKRYGSEYREYMARIPRLFPTRKIL
jgi:protein-S-isoprenylcysteine O-methyltransferase Ste14